MMLKEYGNVVPGGYQYYAKQVTPRAELICAAAYFKWYDIYPSDVEITQTQSQEAREFVVVEATRLKLTHDLGFVMLHHTPTALLLMINVWRNTNEIWEAAYFKRLDSKNGYHEIEFANNLRGTFCVWELAPVMHERHAWVRFLSSARDERAKQDYVSDRFNGLI